MVFYVNYRIEYGWMVGHYVGIGGSVGIYKIFRENYQRFNLFELDDDGCNIFHHACSSGNLELVKALADDCLIDVGLPDNEHLQGIHLACIEGALDVVDFLLNHPRIDPNAVNESGWTSLMLMSRINGPRSISIVSVLLSSAKVNLLSTTNEGTPFNVTKRYECFAHGDNE